MKVTHDLRITLPSSTLPPVYLYLEQPPTIDRIRKSFIRGGPDDKENMRREAQRLRQPLLAEGMNGSEYRAEVRVHS